jgi:hypothetical protein
VIVRADFALAEQVGPELRLVGWLVAVFPSGGSLILPSGAHRSPWTGLHGWVWEPERDQAALWGSVAILEATAL